MNIAVITSHFNPAGYRTPRRNLLRFMRQLEAEAIPLYVAELAYDDEPWLLPSRSNILQVRTARKNVMWHKENLLNMLEKLVPAEFDALAWIDADVWFQRLDWYDAIGHGLQSKAVLQPFQYVVQTSQDGTVSAKLAGAAHAGYYSPGQTTPGFAWAARRTLWQKAGGLYERAIIGGGDALHATVWLPTRNDPTNWLNYSGASNALVPLREWCESQGGCAGLDGTIWHEWHGNQANRRYVIRHRIVKELNVERELARRGDGLLEFSDTVGEPFRTQISEYFSSREEDGLISLPEPQPVPAPASREVSTVSSNPALTPQFKSSLEIINWLVRSRGYHSILGVNVSDAKTFHYIDSVTKECVTTDSNVFKRLPAARLMASDIFFAQNKKKFDLVLIEGPSDAEYLERDVLGALAVLTKEGMIIVYRLCPFKERGQRGPRQTQVQTGERWKAWVKLRHQRPSLTMVVIDCDQGVGIIFPSGALLTPPISVPEQDLTWGNFDRERRNWLNLMPPNSLDQILFRESDFESGLTVVILWREPWNATHERLLGWLERESFPKGTHFVWNVPTGSRTETELESRWQNFTLKECEYTCEIISTAEPNLPSDVERSHWVAALYNEAMTSVRSELTMFIADFVSAEDGAAIRLLETINSQSLNVAGVTATYPCRKQATRVGAKDSRGIYLKYPANGNNALVDVEWTESAFTVYRTRALRSTGKFLAKTQGRMLIGTWDVHFCKALRDRGCRILLDQSNRVSRSELQNG